jgi:O-methyltransferase
LNQNVPILIKEILFNTPLRKYFFPRYNCYFTPIQLLFICQCIDHTNHCDGCIAEVGCARGATTVFLNKYIDGQTIQKIYFAIDTFAGFVREDIVFEIVNRAKSGNLYSGGASFSVNKKKWFDKTMQQNGIARVRSIRANVNEYDFKTLAPVSFALLDVDLYRPTKKALHGLFEVLSPGGMIVVDDCDSSQIQWDGSDQAYKEFMQEINQTPEIIHEKLGVIRKPRCFG